MNDKYYHIMYIKGSLRTILLKEMIYYRIKIQYIHHYYY